jgi:predicted nucleic acid-binding protein
LCFVDTSAYYALVDRDERATHPQAIAIAGKLAARRWRLFTTNFVVAETHGLILLRLGGAVAGQALEELDSSRDTTIIRVSEDDEQMARATLKTYQDKGFSLIDATSFAVMQRLGISYAFSFDRHFAQYGFTIATPDSLEID